MGTIRNINKMNDNNNDGKTMNDEHNNNDELYVDDYNDIRNELFKEFGRAENNSCAS